MGAFALGSLGGCVDGVPCGCGGGGGGESITVCGKGCGGFTVPSFIEVYSDAGYTVLVAGDDETPVDCLTFTPEGSGPATYYIRIAADKFEVHESSVELSPGQDYTPDLTVDGDHVCFGLCSDGPPLYGASPIPWPRTLPFVDIIHGSGTATYSDGLHRWAGSLTATLPGCDSPGSITYVLNNDVSLGYSIEIEWVGDLVDGCPGTGMAFAFVPSAGGDWDRGELVCDGPCVSIGDSGSGSHGTPRLLWPLGEELLIAFGGDCTIPPPDPIACDPCEIPAGMLTSHAVANNYSSGPGVNFGAAMYGVGSTRIGNCIAAVNPPASLDLACEGGNTQLTVNLRSSNSCGASTTAYTWTYGTHSSYLVLGEWETIASENFDGVTAPSAAISGWTVASGLVTSTAHSPTFTNSLALLSGHPAGYYFATRGTADAHGGNVRVSAWFRLTESGRNSEFGLTARGSASSIGGASGTYYHAAVRDVDFTATGMDITIDIVSGGSRTNLALLNASTSPADIWHRLIFTAVGPDLWIQLQRASDGYYLNSSAAYVSDPVACLHASNGTITGSGYSGVTFWEQSTVASPVYADDYLIEGIHDTSDCDPYYFVWSVLPGNPLHDAGYLTFSVAE